MTTHQESTYMRYQQSIFEKKQTLNKLVLNMMKWGHSGPSTNFDDGDNKHLNKWT